MQSVEALLGVNQGLIDYSALDESTNNQTSLVQQDSDPEEAFNRKWGYLPPLDEEAAAIIDAIILDPSKAMDYARVNPSNNGFYRGLERRNVMLEEAADPDPYANNCNDLPQFALEETDAERESYERLWALDRAKCVNGSNEALFQRTLMMGFIARHCLIYGQGATEPRYLDFSVEELWNCPSMPTGDYNLVSKFLTQPKPDLAVCFSRKNLIPNALWQQLPDATQRLACYEKPNRLGVSRAFHFFTIEGKKSLTPIDDEKAMYQSLNNASQALHNMFEFFQDAGPRHRAKFFSEVRFFSVVASTEGLNVRIHRATEVGGAGSEDEFVVPGYPLRFEFREFARVPKDKFDRKTVLELFGKILVSYGTEKLHVLLQDAAKTLVGKLRNDPEGSKLRQNLDFYRHGQTGHTPKDSKMPTPLASRGQSVQTPMSVETERSGMLDGSQNMAAPRADQSFDMLRSRTATPTQSQPPGSSQLSNSSGKRQRNQAEENNPQRRSRRPKQ